MKNRTFIIILAFLLLAFSATSIILGEAFADSQLVIAGAIFVSTSFLLLTLEVLFNKDEKDNK